MKTFLLIAFTIMSVISFGQSSQEIIDAKTLFIIAETDSLSELKELANKKIDAETEKINRFEDSLLRVSNYTNLVNSIKVNDSILEYLNKRKNIYSRNIDRYTSRVLNDEWDSDNDTYKSRGYETKENREKRLDGVVDFYNKSKSDMLTWKKNLVEKRDSVKVMTLEQGNWSNSSTGFNSSAERNAFIIKLLDKISSSPYGWEEGKHVIIPSKIYSKWINQLNVTGLINTVSYNSNYPSSSQRKFIEKINKKMDEDDYVIIRFFSINDKDGFGVPEIEAENYLNPWNFKVKGLLSKKKLEKVIEEYQAKGAKRIIDDDSDDYIHHQEFWFEEFVKFREIATLEEQQEKYKKFSESYDSLLTITKPMRSSSSQIENKLALEKKSAERKISNLTNRINSYDRIINRKDERILKVQSDEIMRVKLISEADSLLQIKNYELAISNYQQAQNLFNHADVFPKLENATKLYAPILAKKQEEERLARIERERLAREAEIRRRREMPSSVLNYLFNARDISSAGEVVDFEMEDISSCLSIAIVRVSDVNQYGRVIYLDYEVDIAYGSPCYHEYKPKRLSSWDLEIKKNFLQRNYSYFTKISNSERDRERQIEQVDEYYRLYRNRTSVVCGCNF